MKKAAYFLLTAIGLTILSGNISFAQQQVTTPQAAENAILYYLRKMDYWRKQDVDNSVDSLYKYNEKLQQYMSDITHNPFMLTAPFPHLRAAGMDISTSEDHMCRTYVWDVISSAAMHYRNSLLVYKSDNDVVGAMHKEGLVTEDIHTIHTLRGQTVYMIRVENTYTLKDRSCGYASYIIDHGFFTDKPFFFNSVDSDSYAGYRYDISTYKIREHKLPLTRLTPNGDKVYVPIVKEGGIYDGLNLVYKFDGNRFVYEKIKKIL